MSNTWDSVCEAVYAFRDGDCVFIIRLYAVCKISMDELLMLRVTKVSTYKVYRQTFLTND